MSLKKYWYIVGASADLRKNKCISTTILKESIVCFRNSNGQVTALQNRCLHRQGKLSEGHCRDGVLTCPYHGWQYNHQGEVIHIPSMGNNRETLQQLRAHCYETREQDGYIYVRLDSSDTQIEPHVMPYYQQKKWRNIRLVNEFENSLNNCIENFIDIPHTAYVHPYLFRVPKQQKILAKIVRKQGHVLVTYQNESTNLGLFARLLNPKGVAVMHTDHFYMPNITSVRYQIDEKIQFIITSQSVPVHDTLTRVYTDLTFNFGWFTALSTPFVKMVGQKVIDQDKIILRDQQEVLNQYGRKFINTPADKIHSYVDSILAAIISGENPIHLAEEQTDVEFFV